MKQNIEIKSFESDTGVSEYHWMIHVADGTCSFQEQLNQILQDYHELRTQVYPDAVPVFGRFFLSDSANQQHCLTDFIKSCGFAVSVVEQPPLDGTKIALWVYLQTGVKVQAQGDALFEVTHGTYRHYWSASWKRPSLVGSEKQTQDMLNHYALQLEQRQCSLLHHCVRTWFFVQNVDVNYAGVVTGRNQVFDVYGLTSQTHFIASTGIGGREASADVLVLMDAYSVSGLQEGQMTYLYASRQMNSTAEYGVRFERGTCVDYGDRRHVFISGTASIDNKGAVVYPQDIRKQVHRMWENVEALLQEAGCSFADVGYMLVYLRDISDRQLVRQLFHERFPGVPLILLWAPVCRPGWLIEMECMAIHFRKNAPWPCF